MNPVLGGYYTPIQNDIGAAYAMVFPLIPSGESAEPSQPGWSPGLYRIASGRQTRRKIMSYVLLASDEGVVILGQAVLVNRFGCHGASTT